MDWRVITANARAFRQGTWAVESSGYIQIEDVCNKYRLIQRKTDILVLEACFDASKISMSIPVNFKRDTHENCYLAETMCSKVFDQYSI